MKKHLAIERLAIVAVLALCAFIVGPHGNFPINDDFNFAHATWSFVETGHIEFTRLTGMSLRLQVLWGAIWTLLCGKSFEVLRASSACLGILSVLVVHRFLHELGVSRAARIAGTLVFAAHPIFFATAFSFMTHVPFVFVSVLSLYASWRYAKSGERRWAAAAVLAVLASCFIRQTGLANAAPLALVAMWAAPRSVRLERLIVAATPVVAFCVLFLFTPYLHGYPGQISEHYALWKSPHLLHNLLYGGPLHWTVYAFQYAALFAPAAVLALAFIRPRSTREWLAWLVIAAPFLMVATHLATVGFVMPYRFGGNMIANFAYGPLTLRDTFCFDQDYVFDVGFGARTLLTYVTALAGAHLLFVVLSLLFRALRRQSDEGKLTAVGLCAAHALGGAVMLYPSGIFFDRYSLDCLWSLPVIGAVVLDDRRRLLALSSAMAIVQLAICAIGLSEYMSWQRARWRAWEFAHARGVTLRQIDAGYEINQYLLGGVHGKWKLDLCGMSVVDDEYILTFRPVSGWRPIAGFGYRSFAGLRTGAVLLSHREGLSPLHRLPPKKDAWDR